MIDPVVDRRAAMSPQLAVRAAVLASITFAMFAVIFFRLWFLQVLSGDRFLAEATQNRARQQVEQAPRGFIVDRTGNPLVQNRKATVLELDARSIPGEERALAAVYGDAVIKRSRRRPAARGPEVSIPAPPAGVRRRFERLARVTKLSPTEMQELVIVGLYQEPFVPVRLVEDVPAAVRTYAVEHKREFPGLVVRSVFLREYPNREVGAQLFGSVGEINPDQLGEARYRGVKQGALVGQGGLERTYDQYLRGSDGVGQIFVDAAGRPIGASPARGSRGGRQLRTTLDLRLQRSAQASFSRVAGGKAGAFLAMDPETGAVAAMGSAPSFDPNELARPLTRKRAAELYGPRSGAPLINRATSSQYPTGSTFKPVTAFAGLTSGQTTPDRVINDPGFIQIAPGPAGRRTNAKSEAYGSVDLRRAIKVSSDVYFYDLGVRIFNRGGRALQQWAHRLGFGRLTGIDTGAEAVGTVPSRAQRAALNRAEARCRRVRRKSACGIADGTNRPYNLGDNVNLAIGQGDLTATPLQVAMSYAALATGGRIPTPHLGAAIEDDQGRLIQRLPRKAARQIKLPAAGLQAIRDGLRQAAGEKGGTSAAVFDGWNQERWPVHGKTGTAQVAATGLDQSWYVAYVPRTATNKRPLLVVVTVEGGGFGAAAAAPIARQIFSKWYTGKPGPLKVVADTE